MRIQLAVQGGGAKLCGLLAALDAVQALERDKLLQVTRIAGTSAGAIAAALYAARVDFEHLRRRITDNRAKLRRIVPRPGLRMMARAVVGRPMVSLGPIRAALAQVFNEQGVSRFGDLEIPLIVMATDLTNGRAHSFGNDEEESVVNAVLDSCALPFYFRGPGVRDGSNLLVDGGICENLPVDVLRQFGEDDGAVVGITFRPSAPGETPSTVARFSVALLEAAMDNSVRRAQRQLAPERLLALRGDMGTLDFARALDEGMGDRYNVDRNTADQFFRNMIADIDRRATARPPEPDVFVDAGENVDSVATLQAHGDIYMAQHAHVRLHYREARMLVRLRWQHEEDTINDAGDQRRPDTLSYRLSFAAAKSPLECFRISLRTSKDATFLQTLSTGVLDKDYHARPTIPLHARFRNAPEDRAYLLFLNPTIQPDDPDGPFTLQYTHQVLDLLSDLRKKGSETVSCGASRADGPTPKVTIAVVMPRTFMGYSMRESPDTTSTDKGRLMSPEELLQLGQELVLEPDQYVIGWVGTDIEPGSEFATDVYGPGS